MKRMPVCLSVFVALCALCIVTMCLFCFVSMQQPRRFTLCSTDKDS